MNMHDMKRVALLMDLFERATGMNWYFSNRGMDGSRGDLCIAVNRNGERWVSAQIDRVGEAGIRLDLDHELEDVAGVMDAICVAIRQRIATWSGLVSEFAARQAMDELTALGQEMAPEEYGGD